MNEKRFWSAYVRPVLHDPADGWVAWKVQDAFNAGLPDVFWRGPWGWGGVIEMKYQPARPVRADTPLTVAVTPEQRRHLKEWAGDKGHAFVLYGLERTAYLLSLDVPARVPQEELLAFSFGSWSLSNMKHLRGLLHCPYA
jgi:hypothetical protein